MSKTRPSTETFGDRLRMAREMRGLNQRELGELVHLPPSSIAHFEGGRRKPSFDNLQALSQALNVSSDYLIGRADQPAVMPASDPFMRDLSKLRADDRELVEGIVRLMVARKREPRGA